MKLTSKIARWAVCGVVLPFLLGAGVLPASAKLRNGILPAGAHPTQTETQLSITPEAAPAPVQWEMPVDTQKGSRALPIAVKGAQEAPTDSAVAANAMLAKLKAPDGRTRQGLGWFMAVMGTLGILGSGQNFAYALFWIGVGILLLLTGRDKYRTISAARKQAEAAGAAPFTEVRGRVGRGAFLFLFILSGVFAIAGAASFPSLAVLSLTVGAGLGVILFLWRKSAFIKAMQANGFGRKWVK